MVDVPAFESVRDVTTGGDVPLRTGRLRTLAVGGERLPRCCGGAVGRRTLWSRSGMGCCRRYFFDALYVNNREGFVVFNPKARKN